MPMSQTLSFVHLRYFSEPELDAKPGISIVVACTDGKAEVVVRPDWKQRVDPKHHEYFELMMNNWRAATEEELPGLMEELAELPLGPLRAVEAGPITPEKRSSLVSQVLAA